VSSRRDRRDREPTSRLETEHLRLDPLRIEDAGEMAFVLADPGLYAFIGGEPPTVADLEAQYGSWLAGPSRAGEEWLNWVVRIEAGKAIGHAQATVLDGGRTADIAWVIGLPWQGRGYASEAAIAIVGHLEAAGVGSVTAHVRADNLASAKVAQRAGLRRTTLEEGGETVWRRVAKRRESTAS
jgi:RimJ/RimL family protein N-acetyltransferase